MMTKDAYVKYWGEHREKIQQYCQTRGTASFGVDIKPPSKLRKSTTKHLKSIKEILIEVASKLSQPFTESQLVVAAWKQYPDRFCLHGYPEYPDSNRVRAELCGQKGLVALGYFVKEGPKLYRVKTTLDTPIYIEEKTDGN